MKVIDALAGNNNSNTKFATLFHQFRQRYVFRKAMCLIQYDGKAQTIGIAPMEHVFVDFTKDKGSRCYLQLFCIEVVEINDQPLTNRREHVWGILYRLEQVHLQQRTTPCCDII